MADASRVVELVFKGVDQTGAAVDNVLRNTQRVNTQVADITEPLANVTSAAFKLEGALLATGAAAAMFAVKVAGDFDAAFREIATLVDEPTEALADFRQEILDYSRESTQSLEQITGAVYSAISAGASYTDSVAAVAQAERLAVAGKADLNDSLVVLVSALNAYGEGMDEAEHYSDLLFTTVRQGQTTLPELAGSLSAVTSLAANAGVDFGELLAAVAALTATGAPTSEAITSIRAALSNIIKPTKEAADLAAELGIEFNASALETKGLAGVLGDVRDASGGNVEIMGKLFGSVNGLNAVLGLTGEGADLFAGSLDAMAGSAGAVDEAFEKMAGQISHGNQAIKNALQGMFIEIGEPLLDEFGGVQAAIAQIINSIATELRDGELQQFVVLLEDMAREIQTTFEAIARNLPEALEQADYTGFFNGIERLRQSLGALFEGADLTTAEGLAVVIGKIGDAFEFLSTYVAGAIEGLAPFLRQLASLADTVLSINPEIIGMIGVVGGVATAVNAVTGPMNTLLIALLALGGKGGAIAGATAAAGALAPVIGTAGLALAAGASVVKIGELVSILYDWQQAASEAAASADLAERTAGDLADRLGELSIELDIPFSTIDEFNRLVSEGVIVVDEVNNRWARASDVVGEWGTSSVDASRRVREELGQLEQAIPDDSPFDDPHLLGALQLDALAELYESMGLVYDQATGGIRSVADAVADSADALAGANDTGEQWIETVEDGVRTFQQAGKAYGAALDPAAEALEDAVAQSETFRIKMEELASNERIKLIEARVQLNVAELEADTRRVEAAFNSINATVDSTGTLLGTLFGAFGEASRYEQIELQRQIDMENRRRDEALRLQKDLTQAQVDSLRARTRAMERGDAMVRVDGAGLQPHLEAIMWELLRAIQVRVNADGESLLLGLPA